MRRVVLLLALLAVALTPMGARAESLVAALSSTKVFITSNFTGTEIAVFGAVEQDAGTISRQGPYDIAVVLTGPKKTFVTRKKERLAGLYVNREARTYVDVPSFYSIATTRPLADIAVDALLKRFQLGLEYILLPESVVGGVEVLAGHENFRDAFFRLKQRGGVYREDIGRVEFLTERVYRVNMSIPANVPVGDYTVDVYLFRDQALLAQQRVTFGVEKVGFEQFMDQAAFTHSWAYGFGAVALALLTGWIAGVIFRKD